MEINDQDFKEFVYQLKHNLGPALNQLTKSGTTGTMGDSGINKLINAIGLLSVSINQAAGKKRNESKALDEFTATVEKSTKRQADAQKEATDSTDELAESQKEATKTTKKLTEFEKQYNREASYKRKVDKEQANAQASYFRDQINQYSSTSGLMGLAGEGFKSLAGNSIGATIAFEGLGAVVSGVTSGLTTMAKAIYSGERGAAVSAKAFTGLISPITSFAQGLGGAMVTIGGAMMLVPGFGTAIGGLVAGVGAITATLATLAKGGEDVIKASAEQADALFKSYNDLSAAGVNTTRGLTGVIDMAHTLGYSVSQLGEFNKLVGDNAKTMKFFGGTTAEGVHAYSKATNILMEKFGPELEQLGITAQDQREAALSYMSIQARTGGLQLKSAKELAKGTNNYLYELDAISRLTGATRKEQEAEREAAMANERFRSALVDAKNRGDTAETARLEKAQAIASAVSLLGDKKGSIGILQGASSRGALNTPETQAAELTYSFSKVLNNPNLTSTQALIEMVKSAEAQQRQLAGINSFIGGIGSLQTDVVGIANLVDKARLAIEAAQKAGMSLDDFLKTEQGKAQFGDKSLKDAKEAYRKQQAAAITMDQVLLTFNGAAKLNNDASELFDKAVNRFANTVGARKGPNPYNSKNSGVTSTGPGKGQTFGSNGGGAAFGNPNLSGQGANASSKRHPSNTKQAVAPRPTDTLKAQEWDSKYGAGWNADGTSKDAVGKTSMSKILDLIGQVEAGSSGYNSLVGNGTADLTNMTLTEVYKLQNQMLQKGSGFKSSAVGKYQFIFGTLLETAKALNLDPNTTKFDASTQDMLAAELVRQKGYDQYSSGTLPKEQFLQNLAQTWAGLPYYQNGAGYYDGKNGNKAGIGWDAALQSFGNGGVVTAKSGGQVILTAEAGLNEAVVPLPDGKAIPVNLGTGFDKMVAIMEQTNAILQNLHSTSKDTYSVNNKILQATRA